MSATKRFLEDLSVIRGGDGEINQETLDLGNALGDLLEKHGLHFHVDCDSLRIVLQGGRELNHTEAAVLVVGVADKITDYDADVERLKFLANLLEDGCLRQAHDYANAMETGCRERIPHEVWRLLISYREYRPENPSVGE